MRTVILSFFIEAMRLKHAYEKLFYNPNEISRGGAGIIFGTDKFVIGLDWDETNNCAKIKEGGENAEKIQEKLQLMLDNQGRGFYSLENLLHIMKKEQEYMSTVNTEGIEPDSDQGAEAAVEMLWQGIQGSYAALKDVFAEKGITIDEEPAFTKLSVEDMTRIEAEQEAMNPMAMMAKLFQQHFGGNAEVLHVGNNSLGVAISLGGEEEEGAEEQETAAPQSAPSEAVNTADENIT